MEDNFSRKAKECCSKEHKRLMEDLSRCDSQFSPGTSSRHRCYGTAAQRSGERSKQCIIDA
jgi:hypothetical protein